MQQLRELAKAEAEASLEKLASLRSVLLGLPLRYLAPHCTPSFTAHNSAWSL